MNTPNVNQALSPQLFQIVTKASLETLSPGDIIKGRVLSVDNGLLYIKLIDGAVFTAKAPEGFSAEPGDLITLMMGEKMNDQLTARIINEPQNGIRPNEESVLINNIHNALESNGVTNPGSMTAKVMELLHNMPGSSLDRAAFIVANGLSVTSELSEVIQKIADHEFNLHENLKSLENGIVDSLSAMGSREVSTLLEPLLIKQTVEEITADLRTGFPETSERLIATVSEKLNEILTKTFMDEISGQESADASEIITKDVFEAIVGNALRLASKGEDNSTGLDKAYPSFTPEQAENILKVLNRALEDYHTRTGKISKGGEESIKELKKVIEKLFDKAYIKADGGVVRDVDIKEKSRALKDIMELAQKVIKHTGDNGRDPLLPAFRETDNAFKFFSQAATYNSIIQLPLKINGTDSTGELYIMRRGKGRKSINRENFTLFLSLKTESLGIVESYLNAARKRITISFRVENEDLMRMFKDNQKELYDRFLEKGYILVEMKCRLLDGERLSPFNAGSRAKELFGAESKVDIRI